MSTLIDEIKSAWCEITGVVALIDILYDLQSKIDLHNLWDSGQISLELYLIRVILEWVLLPAVPGILFGILLHRIRKRRKK